MSKLFIRLRLAVIILILIIIGFIVFLVFYLDHNLTKVVVIEPDNDLTQPDITDNFNQSDIEKFDYLTTKEKNGLRLFDGRLNILLLGLDGSERRSGNKLTDTIALASVDTQNYRSALLSIPRDLYVQIPGSDSWTKINALYAYGLRNAGRETKNNYIKQPEGGVSDFFSDKRKADYPNLENSQNDRNEQYKQNNFNSQKDQKRGSNLVVNNETQNGSTNQKMIAEGENKEENKVISQQKNNLINSQDSQGTVADNTIAAAQLIKQVVENITGQPIPYYVIIDFEGFKKIIDILGGINVYVPENIKDTRYPGPNYSYETFELKKGWQHLDAETALKYVRVRHVKGGDFGRARRQQQVLAAMKEKALQLRILTNPIKIIKIINVLGQHVKTNIGKAEMLALLPIVKNVNIHQTNTVVLTAWDAEAVLRVDHVWLGGQRAFVLRPRRNDYQDIRSIAANIFDWQKKDQQKQEIVAEKASLKLLTPNYQDYLQLKEELQEIGYTKIDPFQVKEYESFCLNGVGEIISFTGKEKLHSLDSLIKITGYPVRYVNVDENNFSEEVIEKERPALRQGSKPDIVVCLADYNKRSQKNARNFDKQE